MNEVLQVFGCIRQAHRAVALANAVFAHDVEDAMTDGVSVAAAPRKPRQGHARQLLRHRVAAAPRL